MFLGALSAQAGVAVSDNIYGVINIPIQVGMNAVGVNLIPIDPSADFFDDVILTNGLTVGDSSTGDGLWIYGETYDKYYLSATGWRKDESGLAPVATLGLGAWIKAYTNGTVYQVGIVTNTSSFNVAAAATGYSFIANPFPADLDVNTDISWTGIVTGGSTPTSSDRLLIWNGVKYDYYYYSVVGETTNGWYSTVNKGKAPLIRAGEGFFLQRKSSNAAAIPVANPLD